MSIYADKRSNIRRFYNNTLYGSNLFIEDTKTADYANNFLFDIFNNKITLQLEVSFRYILLPAYKMMLSSLETGIINDITTNQNIYWAILAILFALVIIGYIGIWRPFENRLNQTVIYIILIRRFIKQRICFLLYLKKY
jgi:hypothetical protein